MKHMFFIQVFKSEVPFLKKSLCNKHTHTLTHSVVAAMTCGAQQCGEQVSGHSPLVSVCGADRPSANLWPPSVSH